MKTFEANTPQEKWIKSKFESKSELIRATGLSRPTIDKICRDVSFFYKYVPLFSRVSKESKESIINSIS